MKRERDAKRGLVIWENLHSLFTEKGATAPDFARMLNSMETYRNALLRLATSDLLGVLTDKERDFIIIEDLRADAIVDSKNKRKARRELSIIEEAYNSDPEYWNKWIERRKRYTRDLREMPQ